MLSFAEFARSTRNIVSLLGLGLVAVAAVPTAAQAQTFLGIPAGAEKIVCVTGAGEIYIINSSDDCTISDPADSDFPTGFQVGNATFNDTTNATTFTGGTVTVNAPMTLTGPTALNGTNTFGGTATFSAGTTFNALADFNNGITSDTITNSGTISTATLNATTVSAGTIVGTSVTASGLLRASAGTTVDMGNNVVTNVAAGVAGTDAVNVNQLNAATSGIVSDVTALETLTATHTTQITALQAADLAFDTRIDTLELLAEGLDERIGKVDDRASAGTAAAVALSGAMFLPGKSFNLTGNIGTYRGARAAAIQFGALVSDNIALNAGIAHGFNKGGRTAMRAGFTIGW